MINKNPRHTYVSGELYSVESLCLENCEFHSRAVDAVDVVAGGIALEVEAIFFGAGGDNDILNQFAIHAVDGENGVECHVDGNHDVVGSGVGVGRGGRERGVFFNSYRVNIGEDVVDHAVT